MVVNLHMHLPRAHLALKKADCSQFRLLVLFYRRLLTRQMQKSRLEHLPGWQRALILAVPIVCATLLFAFITEGALRARQSIREGVPWGSSFWGTDQTYVTDPESGLRILIPNGHFGPVHINSFGFRSPDIPVEK